MTWFGKKQPRLTPDEWRALVAREPLLDGMDSGELGRLHDSCGELVRTKTFEGCGGLVVDDAMRWRIAAQACLLVLELGIEAYSQFSSVLVYPREFRTRWSFEDEHGIVTEEDGPMLGEAWPGGPVVLSWEDVADGRDEGFNLVVHEFAHKLDMLSGSEDGMPPLHPGMDRDAWSAAFESARGRIARIEAAGEEPTVDPYALEDAAECFAVFSETFFASPLVVQQDFPAVYEQLEAFYRQDPALRWLRRTSR